MTRDMEKATKAAQTAELLCKDLAELVKSDNLLLSEMAFAELTIAANLRVRLERLQTNLETMEARS